MEAILPIIVGLILIFIAFKVLTGILKTLGIIGAIIVAAVLYFTIGGGTL